MERTTVAATVHVAALHHPRMAVARAAVWVWWHTTIPGPFWRRACPHGCRRVSICVSEEQRVSLEG